MQNMHNQAVSVLQARKEVKVKKSKVKLVSNVSCLRTT